MFELTETMYLQMCYPRPKLSTEDPYPTPHIIAYMQRLLSTTCARLAAYVNLNQQIIICPNCHLHDDTPIEYTLAETHFLYEGALLLNKCENCGTCLVNTRSILDCGECTSHYSTYIMYLNNNDRQLLDQEDEILIATEPRWLPLCLSTTEQSVLFDSDSDDET